MSADIATSHEAAGIAVLLQRGRRRLRAVWLNATATQFAPWLVGFALLVALLGWVRPWAWPEPAALLLLLVGAVGVGFGSLALRLPEPLVARALDRGLDTNNALVTALQFAPSDDFGRRVQARATSYASADVSEALPLQWRPKPWLLSLVLGGGIVAAVLLGNPQDDVREQLAADRAAIEEVADELRERAAELEDDSANTESEELAEQLKALALALENSANLDTAIDELRDAQNELLRSIDAESLAQRAAAQGLERTLSANPVAAGSTAAAQLAALADSVAELDAEEAATLADRLEQLAETQGAGDPATSEALEDAAEALAAGDTAGAAAALNAAAASAATASAEAASGQQVSAAATAVGQAAGELEERRGGEGQGLGQGQGEGQGLGEGQGEGQSQGQGQGEGQGQGQGSGSGTGMSATGQNPSGSASSNPGVNGSGNQGEGIAAPPPDTPVLIWRDGISDTSSANVDATSGEAVDTGQRVEGPTGAGTSRVPLESIANDFADRATTALDGTNIAPSEADTVARYFDSLTQG